MALRARYQYQSRKFSWPLVFRLFYSTFWVNVWLAANAFDSFLIFKIRFGSRFNNFETLLLIQCSFIVARVGERNAGQYVLDLKLRQFNRCANFGVFNFRPAKVS